MQQEHVEHVEGIDGLIENFLIDKKHIGVSLNWLAKQTSIPYTSLKRFKEGKSTPNPTQITDILQMIGRQDLIKEMMAKYHPNVDVKNELCINLDDIVYPDLNIEDLFRNPRYFDILAETFTKKGMKLERVRLKFGSAGVEIAGELIDMGVIELDLKDETLYPMDRDHIISPNGDTCRENIRNALKYWDKRKSGTKQNTISWQVYAMNKEVSETVQEITQQMRNLLREVIRDGQASYDTQKAFNEILYRKINNKEDETSKNKFIGLVYDDFDLPERDLGAGLLQ